MATEQFVFKSSWKFILEIFLKIVHEEAPSTKKDPLISSGRILIKDIALN